MTSYASNSNQDKADGPEDEKVVEKVIEGGAVQRKKPLGRRIAENFKGEDGASVGQYVLMEVILPRVKDLIFDVGESALRRTLFGGTAQGYSSRSVSTRGYTPYANGGGATPKAAVQPKAVSNIPSDVVSEFVVESRGDAQEVMDKVGNLIEAYGQASVADLKSALGITGNFIDEKFGWVNMGYTDIKRVGGQFPGYALIFPPPIELP